ncbi:hypothetical protein [Deinococcus petrolearius]|uniref:SPW repeat-containing protein n=1 Tax=Deinococcus petrolearius TaxID=1751295 RepID=A0ABW1DFG7_9DEIO
MGSVNVPAPHPSSPHDPALAGAGRVPAQAALAALFMLGTVPFLAGLLQGQTGDFARNVLYACATAALLAQVWLGSVWAWRVTVGLSMFTGILVFIVGMLAGTVNPQGWVVSVAGMAYIALGLLLVGHPAIRAFLDGRWEARRARRPGRRGGAR